MEQRRVVITGIGIVAPSAITTETFWEACIKDQAPVAPIPEQWKDYAACASDIWAPLPPLDTSEYGFTRIHLRQYSRSSILGMCAAAQALMQAGFSCKCIDEKKLRYAISGLRPERAGVIAGTGVGGLVSLIANQANHVLIPQKTVLKQIRECPQCRERAERITGFMRMPPRFNPFVVSIIMPNAVSSSIGIRYGLTGRNTTVTCACAAGTVAIGEAFNAVRRGELDVVLAGGAEYLADEFGGIFRGFDIAGTLVRDYTDPRQANRPFDKARKGFLFSEGGAAFCVLEELSHARERGVIPVAEVRGFAQTFDAFSMMSIDPDFSEIERMERMVLADAGFEADTIDYINAHGTGTLGNDDTESRMIRKVFGPSCAVNSTKSLIGHTIGAAGAIETAVTAMSLQHGTTHLCHNLENPVNDCAYVRHAGSHDLKRAITHSFAFGGHNAALALQKAG